jgi:DNA-directed RNA polymerase specialized sigma24 family protein
MTHTEQLEQLYVFAVYMLGSRDEAFTAIDTVTAQHPGAPERWLEALVRPFLVRHAAPRSDHFAELDDILRTNSTIPIDLSHPLVRGDARRLGVLLSELQRNCLISTLQGITAERRAVFILRHVLGLSAETCAAVCGATAGAIIVAENRGRRDLEGYLGARCEHMDPGNACRCAARLGNALDRGLVRWPEHHEHDATPLPAQTYRNVQDLYGSLPRDHSGNRLRTGDRACCVRLSDHV